MPRRNDGKAANKAAAVQDNHESPAPRKGAKTDAPTTSQPLAMVEVVGEDLVIKSDHATLICIPEDTDQPYCCLDAVLMSDADTHRKEAFHYVTTARFYVLCSLQLLRLDDGREALYLYSQDYDSLSTQQKGKYVVVMYLPLKVRSNNYKTESDAHYWGKHEIKEIKSISTTAAFDTPDLQAFVKNYKPFKEFGIFNNLVDLVALYKMPVDALLNKCNAAGVARIEAYCKEHLQQSSVMGQVRGMRCSTLAANYVRLYRRVSSLKEPFSERFKRVTSLNERPRTRSTPPRQVKAAEAREEPSDADVEKAPERAAAKPDAVPAAAPAAVLAAAPTAAPAAAPKLAARALFGSAASKKPKSRAEIMQAMASRPPAGVAAQKAGRGAPAPTPSVRPAPPPPAPPARAPAATCDPQLEVDPEPSPAPEEGAEVAETRPASPAPAASAQKKKRAARGAPDAVSTAAEPGSKRVRKPAVAKEPEVVKPVTPDGTYPNSTRKGMEYETTKKKVDKLGHLVLPTLKSGAKNVDTKFILEQLLDIFESSKNKKKKKAKGAASSAADDDETVAMAAAVDLEEEKVSPEEIEKLKALHAEELKLVKDKYEDKVKQQEAEYEDKMKEQEADLMREMTESESKSSKLMVEMESTMVEMRTKLIADAARFEAKIEMLESQLHKANDEKEAAFVRGWNQCDLKMTGSKTRSGAH